MPHLIEPAPTGRAKCRACTKAIAKGSLRLGESVPNPYADEEGAETMHWYHPVCAAYKRPEAFLKAVEGTNQVIEHRDALEAAAVLGVEHRRVARVDRAERAASGRAACRACKTPIEKGAWRIALDFYEDGRFAPSGFIHLPCAAAYLESTAILDRLRHFSAELTAGDVAEIEAGLTPS
jgi:hypothetical protein